ncbi:gamma-glutamyl-gamma-aminobutyrate hydrolase family protein [Iocasia frigidifontis]|uniref:Gamma-glutamyl-gamma-aminobutyrate hydrolase family protein n=1 Tax=Iocasia fonsfrigidae TaxID=2682810 RepID=A0A8A7KCC0_9FIRM|nr:gamma-glutamyl-gamma-aminobutyrate hydrolase family protein [Iocasia fonsfrigidae]QTL99503.1 gamma-glutamyl-gamma-aminobutyrate hydrolase family protein [Iocasia fonsfrigidae]
MSSPLIGIIPSRQNNFQEYRLNKNYLAAVVAAGGLPVILGIENSDSLIKKYINRIDGLLLTGGLDLDPLLYGESPVPALRRNDPERDNFELQLCRKAYKNRLPILGICKGCQLINVAFGGTLYQDLITQRDRVIKHEQSAPRWYPTHRIKINKETALYQLISLDEITVNSLHHQAVKDIADNFVIAARAEDGVVEAIETKGDGFVLGVQWHPEAIWQQSKAAAVLFDGFIQACCFYRKSDENIKFGR